MKKKALWASAHQIGEDQLEDLRQQGFEVGTLKSMNHLLWEELTTLKRDSDRLQIANELLAFCRKGGYILVQPAGDPAFQLALGVMKAEWPNISVIYSFTKRESKDIHQSDGSVNKISVFKHEGWVS